MDVEGGDRPIRVEEDGGQGLQGLQPHLKQITTVMMMSKTSTNHILFCLRVITTLCANDEVYRLCTNDVISGSL